MTHSENARLVKGNGNDWTKWSNDLVSLRGLLGYGSGKGYQQEEDL
jgi:hypothetical protein